MKGKSSKKEDKVVTESYLESKHYITESYLESKHYVTEDYLDKVLEIRFDKFRKEFREELNEDFSRQIGVMVEEMTHRMKALFQDVKSQVKTHDNWLSDHEDRILRLE